MKNVIVFVMLSLVAVPAFAEMTPEEVTQKLEQRKAEEEANKKIAEDNARALQMLYKNPRAFDAPMEGEAENEPISSKEHEAQQKKYQADQKKKAAKTPDILPSAVLVSQAKKYMGKTFRITVTGDGVVGQKPTKTGCDFQYVNMSNESQGDMVGDGRYYFEAGNLICHHVDRMDGHDINAITMKVKLIGNIKGTDQMGGQIVLPILEVLSRE